MLIYLASPWACKPEAAAVADALEDAGYTITTKWWDRPDSDDPKILRSEAQADLVGVQDCDIFVLLQYAPSEGKAVEMGYALAYGKPVYAVLPGGKAAHIFHHHPRVVQVWSVAELLVDLRREEEWR